MSDSKSGYMSDQLSKPTSIFGFRLWVVVGVCVGAAFVLLLFFITLWLATKRSKNKSSNKSTIPIVSKEIQEVRVDHVRTNNHHHFDMVNKQSRTQIEADPFPEPDPVPGIERQALLPPPEDESPIGYHRINIEIGKDHMISYPERFVRSSSHENGEARCVDQVAMVVPEVSHLGWGHWYTLRELEASTNGFAAENVIGEGGYGIVYHGILEDNSQYDSAPFDRMLVYEYVNNGNLEQWLHGDVGPCSPLTWEIRMNIILGTAKGYVAPEYASTGMLNERSDIYSFGILIMEIITGRNPVDYNRPAEEVNLVEWLKKMVANRNAEGVLDPKLPQKPTSRAMKRALLVALRCVDPNAQKRPKMGHVVHMLEAEESPFKDDRRTAKDIRNATGDTTDNGLKEKQLTESGDYSGNGNGIHTDETRWRNQEEKLSFV
ncbi:hypothetical protein FEM48_Zijuj08G0118500 [Ziziphus jujuba var. spinosa]|uniref:non-specific serine/threonine protein kinase n=1 Tax=Ziziphus jujuba var. spinosa TaxID=714518 RepID=A0A978UYX9_ZIZJJ|nr:hypothetical protein FEM48_Zijuj08G0118500 [Ziziphus jujuba var. spinosa]